jgi:hypothetical protein
MKKLAFVVDKRELSTIRAALFLLQEQVDALPEDLAEMLAEYGQPMTQVEIERLSLRLAEPASLTRDYADRELPQAARVLEVERFPEQQSPEVLSEHSSVHVNDFYGNLANEADHDKKRPTKDARKGVQTCPHNLLQRSRTRSSSFYVTTNSM